MDADVLVVGGGPVGETILALLGSRGVTAIGLERDAEVWPKPRAVHFDGETLRTFQSIGLGEAISELTAPMRTYRMVNEAGEVLLDIPTGFIADQGWIDDVMFHQPPVDALLRERIADTPGIELLTGHEVTSIAQTDDAVSATAVGPGGEERVFTARYLVAADGASSPVRHQLGIRYDELGPHDPWLVVDGLFLDQPRIDQDMLFFGYHTRPRLWAALPGMRRRMEFKVLPGDDMDAIGTPEWIAAETDGVMTPDNFEIDRTAVYTFRSCLAPRWREGRIFLAGDAAHLAPPLFGQGMCSGIRDAANISWKLALVLRGADEQLLDTYESERIPHVRAWIEQATRMSGFVQTVEEPVAAIRDQHIREHPEDGIPAVPPLGHGFHRGSGTRSAQPLVDGRRLDDVAGAGFVVVGRPELLDGLAPDIRSAQDAFDDWCVLDTSTPGAAELLAASEAALVVIRPDRYIYGTAQTIEEARDVLRPVLELLRTVTPAHAH